MSEVVILVTNSGLDNAEKELREKMMVVFLSTLNTFPQLPGKILFYTDGVKLVVEGSPVIGELKEVGGEGANSVTASEALRPEMSEEHWRKPIQGKRGNNV